MSTNYRINAVVSSQGDQLRADMRRNVGSLTDLDRKMDGSSRKMGIWGRQMQAMATTLRYAFAGAVIYGVAKAITGLGDFEKQLGAIDSLVGTVGANNKWDRLSVNIEKIGDAALLTSNKYGVAISDIQSAQQRFASTFSRSDKSLFASGPGGAAKYTKEMNDYVDTLARLQLIAEGASTEQMGNAVGGFASAMNIKNPGAFAKRFLNMWAYVRAQTPTLTGEDLSRDVGMLGQAAQTTGMTPQQIMALYGIAQESGGNPATTSRAFGQLMRASLLHPIKKESKAAYQAAVGTSDPTALRKLGGLEVIRRLLAYVAPHGTTMSKAQKRTLADETLDPGEAAQEARLRGVNLTRAYSLFGRTESTRGFLSLLAQGGPDAIKKFIKGLSDAERDMLGIAQTNQANERNYWNRLKTAQANLPMQLIRGPLAPIIAGMARGMKRASDFTVHHPDAARIAVGGAIGAVAAGRLLMGTGVLGKLPGPLGRFLGRNANRAGAMVAGSGLGAFDTKALGTRSDPLWVVIDPISWLMPAAPDGMGGGSSTIVGGTGGKNSILKKAPWLLAGTGLGTAAALAGGGMAGLGVLAWLDSRSNQTTKDMTAFGTSHKWSRNILNKMFAGQKLTDPERQALAYINIASGAGSSGRGKEYAKKAHDVLMDQQNRGGGSFQNVQIEGNIGATVVVKLVDSKGRALTEERVHVPVTKLPVNPNNPQSRGKKKTMRAGAPPGPH